MCRLFGVVSRHVEPHPEPLATAPRSLAALSPEHPHGWGIAAHDGKSWAIHKSPTCAQADPAFRAVASNARGRVVLAHVRKATVGKTGLDNTHPFRRDAWVFAHNGTISDVAWLERRTSQSRRREIAGDTDSERFFAFLMTTLDEVGATHGSRRAPSGLTHRAIAQAIEAATDRPRFGAVNFLLSDGDVLYAHRFGRSLYLSSEADVVRIASEVPHEGAWQELPERSLLCIDRIAAFAPEVQGCALRRGADSYKLISPHRLRFAQSMPRGPGLCPGPGRGADSPSSGPG
ncbi:class II glutamine amidotransferase [Polyangium sp. 15x6]|uniref:class II glutamine amidotransferase n=1 Tax=Polyangium sp. 15x6 TaxID=3042687 RepID=UPI00249C4B97|nr:class II glutamine amidotransferase [Polyangium sp. 15x6]MDI3285292.1 class II glutamine amidotransferase [Polyangium sp. 15x6]